MSRLLACRRTRLAVATMAASAVLLAGCGAVDVDAPKEQDSGESGESAAKGTPVFISPCALLDKAELERMLGVAVEEPVLNVADPGGDTHDCWVDESHRGAYVEVVVGTTASDGKETRDVKRIASDLERPEPVSGVGRAAVYESQPSAGGTLTGYSNEGTWFYVAVGKLGMPPEEIRQKTLELARAVLVRMSAQHPGEPGALPPRGEPPFSVCDFLPAPARVQALGWATEADGRGEPRRPDEFFGGFSGGGWSCFYGQPQRGEFLFLELRLTKGPVPAARLKGLGRPVAAAGRPAVFSGLQPVKVPSWEDFNDGDLYVSLADGRVIHLRLHDPAKDEAAVERALVALAKVAVSRVPPG